MTATKHEIASLKEIRALSDRAAIWAVYEGVEASNITQECFRKMNQRLDDLIAAVTPHE